MSGAEILLQPGVFPRLLQGLWVTVWIAGVSVGASIPVGLLVGWLMTLKNPVIRAAMRIYLDFIRIMPQLALLFLAYYGFARWFDWISMPPVLRAGVHPVGRRRAGRSGAWRIAVDSQSAVRIELRTGVEPVADLLPGDSAAGCSPYAAGIRKLGDTYRQNDIIGRAARCGRGHQGRPADYRREPIPVPDWNLVDLWRDFLYVLHRVLAAVHCGPPTGKEVVE